MITVLLLSVFILVLCFGFVVLFGAPYLPTLNRQKVLALEILDLSKGQVLVELGSGDGRMLKEAARRGINSIGFEINPILFLFSKLYCWNNRDMIDIRLGNFWKHRLPECDAVYVFLLDKYMEKLNKKITLENKGKMKLVSFAFKIPSKEISTESDGLYLYEYDNR